MMPAKRTLTAALALLLAAAVPASAAASTPDVSVVNIRSGSSWSSPMQDASGEGQGAALGDYLYFPANDGTNGVELWRSNGVTTKLVKNIRSGSASSTPTDFVASNGYVYFTANDGSHGVEVWRSNGTTTNLVTDLKSGNGGSSPNIIAALGGYLYFAGTNGTTGVELWRTDGTSVTLVSDIVAGPGSSKPQLGYVFNDYLYFYIDLATSTQIWRTNGTVTEKVAEPCKLIQYVVDECSFREWEHTSAYGKLDGWLYFASNELGTSGIWRTDGSTTERLANQPVNYGLAPSNFVTAGDYLYFSADDSSSDGYGSQNFRTDGTTIAKVATATGTPESVLTYGMDPVVELNGDVIFNGQDLDGDSHLYKLHAGAVSIVSTPKHGAIASLMTRVGDWVYFMYSTDDIVLYRTNGSSTQKVSKNIVCPVNGNCAIGFQKAGNVLFFQQYTSSIGLELGYLDGTTPVAPSNSAAPAISGTLQVGKTLTAAAGTWGGFPQPTYAYAWARCTGAASAGASLATGCTLISGATKSTYKVVAADQTQGYLLLRVKATNSEGNSYSYSATVQIP